MSLTTENHASSTKESGTTLPTVLSDRSEALNSEFCSIIFPATERLKLGLLKDEKCACQCIFYHLLSLVPELMRLGTSIDLNKLFVRPGSQKHGVGSLLVDWVFEKADAEGLDTYLISVPNPHEFYLHRGFQDRGHYDIDLSPWGSSLVVLACLDFRGWLDLVTLRR